MAASRLAQQYGSDVADTPGRYRQRRESSAQAFLLQHLGLYTIYLLPIRLFIGIGWMRAGIEKMIDPEWRSGSILSGFLREHLTHGIIAFPVYQTFTTGLSLPHAGTLAWIIVVGQLLAGIAILTGTLTNAALIAGLFMNVNFLLVGEPNPSAFYILLQIALLVSHAGYVFGVDAHLSRSIQQPLLCAQPGTLTGPWFCRRIAGAGASLSFCIALYALLHVSDFSPGGSVGDPAMILTVLSTLLAMWFGISYLRQVFDLPAVAPPGAMLHASKTPVQRERTVPGPQPKFHRL